MEVTFYGVRGSIPTPGPETNRYGGNTSCVAVRGASGKLLILDAGTGLVALGKMLMQGDFGRGQGEAALLLTHAHWDHIQGFPFFAPVFVPGNRFRIYGPGRSSEILEGILEGQMNPNFSPLHTMKNLGAAIDLVPIDSERSGTFEEDGLSFSGHENPHGSTTALAYRLEEKGRVFVYASDAGYTADAIPDEAITFYRGAHVLVHDATYTPEDWIDRRERGFSAIREAATAAARAQVKHLVLTHYDQDYGDDFVDGLIERTRGLLDGMGAQAIEVSGAREGRTITV